MYMGQSLCGTSMGKHRHHPYYNKIWTGKPGSQSGFPSISCLSYNKRSNWLTNHPLGLYVRAKDC